MKTTPDSGSLSPETLWNKFKQYFLELPDLGISLDVSRMNFSEQFLEQMEDAAQSAVSEMNELEGGAIANADEQRMVGHYWLRNSELAPTSEIKNEITEMLSSVQEFASSVHAGNFTLPNKQRVQHVLIIGIGGSALGPQFVAKALENSKSCCELHFFDNTDPDGMESVLGKLASDLERTLVLVISKSGGTKETRNGMLEAKHVYTNAGLDFVQYAVAVTGEGSHLQEIANEEQWRHCFPMWDWVGGRTSEFSAVGLLPFALQGGAIKDFLQGAAAMDAHTRNSKTTANPAMLLALMWFHSGSGHGTKAMVVLPYKDRLALFSRYLQQLIMESLGKEFDRKGECVNQGLSVYGNKGATDQHAYVQQLREGPINFFTTFIEVLKDRTGEGIEVESGVTSGDYLHGFYLGTRAALYEKHRESITLTLNEVNAQSVGALIALFERAVGFYASLIDVNAYHQPGVEAGKVAAGVVIQAQLKILEHLNAHSDSSFSVSELAEAISETSETTFKILQHLFVNQRIQCHSNGSIWEYSYGSCAK